MGQYVAKRALASVLVLFIISVLVFTAVRAIPGNVCNIVLQTSDVDKQQCDAINKELGIDKPVVTQYFVYMGNVLSGDFGRSLITKKDVWEEMRVRDKLEALLDKQRSQFKMEERLQTVKQIEELVAEEQYEIYFSTDTRTYFWDKDITNYRPTAWFPYTHIMKTWRDA